MTTGKSFTDELIHNSDHYSRKAFEENPSIKNYSEFSNAVYKYFNTPRGKNAMIGDDDISILWNSEYTKNRIGEEHNKEIEEPYIEQKHNLIIPKIKVKKSKNAKGYYKTKPRKWTSAETKFIEIRKAKGYSISEIMKEFNQWKTETPRTESSISSKLNREKKQNKKTKEKDTIN